MIFASLNPSNASGSNIMVAAPGAGKHYVVYRVYASLDAAAKVTFSAGSGEDAKHHQYCDAKGGHFADGDRKFPLLVGDSNTAITVSADAAVAGAFKVWYDVRTS